MTKPIQIQHNNVTQRSYVSSTEVMAIHVDHPQAMGIYHRRPVSLFITTNIAIIPTLYPTAVSPFGNTSAAQENILMQECLRCKMTPL